MKKKIFISYSHEDEKWKNLLVKHLKVLQLHGELDTWDDQRIKAGGDWFRDIKQAVENAHAAVFLVSADFLVSDFILREEVPALLQGREKGDIKVFPLIARSCPWQKVKWLSAIQARPKGGTPLAMMKEHEAEAAVAAFAGEIDDILKQMPQPASTEHPKTVPPLTLTLSKLPPTSGLLLGRETELDILDRAWDDRDTTIVSLAAFGGV
ncbi:MAG: toll/interleukin-1 receptor domain-containing protein, partial [bacterium]|nr:toll/interleukin-1 receptor domain-containing protein [bacterium]